MAEWRSAIPGARAQGGRMAIADAGPVGMVTLRCDLAAPETAAALSGAGIEIPGTWRASFSGDLTAVWMAPDELLLLTGRDQAPALVARLEDALAGHHHMALDVSDARTVLHLSGPGVAEALAKGAPVDLSPAAFPPGTARRTHLGGLAVVFWRRGEEDWSIACFRSFGRHLFDWLLAAARPGAEVGAW